MDFGIDMGAAGAPQAGGPSNRSGLGRLRFPIDHSPFHRSKIRFEAIEVVPPKVHLDMKPIIQGFTAASNLNTAADQAKKEGRTLSTEERDAALQNLPDESPVNFRGTKYQPLGEICSIHMPISFAVNDNLEYSGARFMSSPTIAGAAAFEAGNPAAQAALGAIADTATSMFNFFTGQTAVEGTGAQLAGLRAGEFIAGAGSEGIRNTLSVVGRVALHPNLRNRFEGVSLRGFTFTFKFLPKSAREAREVQKIIKFFRFHAYPEQIPPDTSFGVGYEYPNLFKIQLLSGAGGGNFKEVGTPIKYSYLRSISTNYNPQTPVLHDDGSPIEIDLTLSFIENKSLKRSDIRKEGTPAFYEIGSQVPMEQRAKEGVGKFNEVASNVGNSIKSGLRSIGDRIVGGL